jgi:hypothetical protein
MPQRKPLEGGIGFEAVTGSRCGLNSRSSSTTYPAVVPSENVTIKPSSPSSSTVRIRTGSAIGNGHLFLCASAILPRPIGRLPLQWSRVASQQGSSKSMHDPVPGFASRRAGAFSEAWVSALHSTARSEIWYFSCPKYRRTFCAGLRISVQMLCPEHSRLLQHYEAALRRWAVAEWSSNRNGSDASFRVSAEIKKKALDERDAARERLNLHERTCPTCIHNQHNPHLVK